MSNIQLSNVAKWHFWAVGLVLGLASTVLRFWSLSQTPFANGWDSYFYLVQLKSLEETGRMHSPEASLIYPYLRFFYWITGDYVLALKVGTATLAGFFTVAVFWLAGSRVRDLPSQIPASSGFRIVSLVFFPLLIAVWSVFSPHLTYFAAQYPKNLLGLVLFVVFIGSLSRLRLSKFSKLGKSWHLEKSQSWLFMSFLLIINYFAHRLTFVLAVIYLLAWFVFKFKNSFFTTIFSRKNLLYAGLVLGLLLLLAGQIFPGLFHLVDFGRLNGVFSAKPQFAPYSFVSQFGMARISIWWLTEVCLATGCWLLVVSYWLSVRGCRLLVVSWGFAKNPKSEIRNPKSPIPNPQSPIPNLLLCGVLLFPFLEWSFTGVAWRFFLVFVLLTPLLVIDFQINKWTRSGLIFVAITLSCSLFSWKSYNPKWHDPDYARFAEVTEKAQQFLRGKQPELLLAHNALAEYFTFTTGTDAMPWLPEYAVDSSRLWRMAAVMNVQTLRYYAGKENEALVTLLGYGYFLLPEHVWQTAMTRAKTEGDEGFLAEMLDWSNPSRVRPGWLLHRKRGS